MISPIGITRGANAVGEAAKAVRQVQPRAAGPHPAAGALGEAMHIARLSQSVIQKAMMVSSRLRNIAAEAMATGNVRDGELTSVLAEVNATLERFGENVTQPTGENAPIPREGGDEIGRAREMIGALERSLTGHRDNGALASDLRRASDQVERAFLPETRGGRAEAEDLSASTAEAISRNPSAALVSQAHISRTVAGRFAGTF